MSIKKMEEIGPSYRNNMEKCYNTKVVWLANIHKFLD